MMGEQTEPSRECGGEAESQTRHIWHTVGELTAWLDAQAADEDPDRTALTRILKLSEEIGEVAEAVIGATGRNPRKVSGHTWDDVRGELCDVVVTGMVALHTLAPDAPSLFAAHLERVAARAGLVPGVVQGAEDADEVRVLAAGPEVPLRSLAQCDGRAYSDPHGLDSA